MIIDDETDKALRKYATDLNATLSEGGLMVGKIYRHPKNGKLLRVTSGQFLVGGRVSNFWYWEYLDDDLVPTGDSDHGYGWTAKPLPEGGSTC